MLVAHQVRPLGLRESWRLTIVPHVKEYSRTIYVSGVYQRAMGTTVAARNTSRTQGAKIKRFVTDGSH